MPAHVLSKSSLLWTVALVAAFAIGRLSNRSSDVEQSRVVKSEQGQEGRSTSNKASNVQITIPGDLQGADATMVTPKGSSPRLVSLEVPGVSAERIAEFAEVLATSNASERHGRFGALLSTLTAAEAKALRRVFHNFGANGNSFYVEWYDFWERWGQIDPTAALTDAAKGDSRETWVRDCARDTLRGWASQDPATAAEWLNSHRDDPLYEAAFTGYIAGVGDRDLTKATQIAINSLSPGDPLLNASMERLAEIAVARGQLTGLIGWFDQLPLGAGEVNARKLAAEHVWTRLQRSENIERTADWVSTTANQPWRSDKLVIETARKYADRNPASAMEWVTSLPPSPGDGRLPGVEQVTRRWMQQDRTALEQWLGSEARTEVADQARAAYAAELVKTDPAAARPWLEAIQDENLRRSVPIPPGQ